MARFVLCFIFLAGALSQAIQPADTLDKGVPAATFANPGQQIESADVLLPLVASEAPDGKSLATADEGICYKIRAYIFKRDDDHAPHVVGSTTCGPREPHAKNVVVPKARIVPAD